eukprot:TRINITY_DN102213_c0_g1_i1.p1 TRINITY_DN102213_c0_g1~~TRINITY_DN102213_c0_g1_i1.p1  ORF type:complete len:819 (-),score=226.76 TRINITY_DN102213_c0_g1_i1:187-2562(-)
MGPEEPVDGPLLLPAHPTRTSSPPQQQAANGDRRKAYASHGSTRGLSSATSGSENESGDQREKQRAPRGTGDKRSEAAMVAEQRRKLEEASLMEDTYLKAVREVMEFMERSEGSAIKAWLRHFDKNNDQKISLNEFIRGMRKMNYPGEATSIFAALDTDHSGELSLEEISEAQSVLWRKFRSWCVASFDSIAVMLQAVAHTTTPVEFVDLPMFTEGIRGCGWDEGMEDMLFQALDIDDKDKLGHHELKWLEIEKRRQRRKEQARRKAMMENAMKRQGNREACNHALASFKKFLRRKYGHYVRAWRMVLSPTGSMVLQRNDVFKAIAAIGWEGDVRALWAAFDRDDSGYVSIEELDAKSAGTLAHFHNFVSEKFGDAAAAFRAFDKYNRRKISQPEFVTAVKAHGFKHPAKQLFYSFNVVLPSAATEDDFLFLDKWKPPAFLTAHPNPQAAEEVKVLLLKTYRNYLKAWRQALDVDNSNRCNWDEFEAACKKIGFRGDLAGAWRTLDDDFGGFITLREIDEVSSNILELFKGWCDQEFGNVRSAFGVFDNDGSNEVSYREFRRSCRMYGFEANVHTLFHALDVEHSGSLSIAEVSFLDDWEFKEHKEKPQEEPPCRRATMTRRTLALDGVISPRGMQNLIAVEQVGSLAYDPTSTTEYISDGPGPAAYAVPSSFASGPMTPMVRFGGAYSFRKRPQIRRLPGIPRDSAHEPAPNTYDDSQGRLGKNALWQNKPSWGFGTAKRDVAAVSEKSPLPVGPGRYSMPRSRSQSAKCTPRRPLRAHPLFKPPLTARE